MVCPVNVVIVGSGGRLGGAIARHFQSNHRVVAFDRKALDLSRPEIISDRLLPIEFDLLINTAALTGVDYCQRHPDEAFAVNAAGPELLARICAEKHARIVHVSTDYVYDGTLPGMKSENAALRPIGVYAKSKREGEVRVQAAAANALIMRTAWVFGPDRPSFVDVILNRAADEPVVDAICDKFSSPTYSHDFATWIEPLTLGCPDGGIFNASNAGNCSWLEYAREAIGIAQELGVELQATHVDLVHLADMEAFVAPRPIHTAMCVSKLAEAIGHPLRPWQDALRDYIQTYYAGT